MLLVNTPGSWSAIHSPFRHAEWHGWTFADLIFPFFLFVVGVTTFLSIAALRKRGATEAQITARILKRGALILLIGLLVSSFPWFPPERIINMRIPGVLQRIGICYTIAALIALKTSIRTQVALAVTLLLGYWYVMVGIPVPGQPVDAPRLEPASATMAAWVDRLLLDGHLWAGTRTWDPEGILSTVPAIVSAMLGTLTAPLILASKPLNERLGRLALIGAALTATGLVWGLVLPINKNIWTSSYVLFAAGMAALALAFFMWGVERSAGRGEEGKKLPFWARPFATFGLNPLVAFVGSMLMARLIYSLIKVEQNGQVVPVQTAIYKAGFESWLAPVNASLLFAFSFVMLWLVILTLLERRNIVIKV